MEEAAASDAPDSFPGGHNASTADTAERPSNLNRISSCHLSQSNAMGDTLPQGLGILATGYSNVVPCPRPDDAGQVLQGATRSRGEREGQDYEDVASNPKTPLHFG